MPVAGSGVTAYRSCQEPMPVGFKSVICGAHGAEENIKKEKPVRLLC